MLWQVSSHLFRIAKESADKNLVSLAHTLASVGKVSVDFSHLKTVIKANGLTVPGQEVESNANSSKSSLYD
jgi:hypothetical protein